MIIGFLWGVFTWLCWILGGFDLIQRVTHSGETEADIRDLDRPPGHISTFGGVIIILLSIVGIFAFGLWSGMHNSR